MDLLTAAALRNVFIPSNLPMMVNISHSISDQYIKSQLNGDTARSTAIENSLNLLVEKMHANIWDDYLVMLSRYLCNEASVRILSKEIGVVRYTSVSNVPSLVRPPLNRPGHKQTEHIILEKYTDMSPKHLLSISQAIDVVASRLAHSTESSPT